MYQHDVCILTSQDAIDLLNDFYGYKVDIDLLNDLCGYELEDNYCWRFHYEDGKWSIR